LQAVFGKNNHRPSEGISLNDICAGLQVLAMDFEHDFRTALHQVLITAFQGRTSEVLGAKVTLLQHGPHCAINDQNPFSQQLFKGQTFFGQISHL
jgi:hypothetical protein